MTVLTTEQQVLDLPDESVVVLTRDRGWLMDTDIYRSWGKGRWQQQDPGDRDDGEQTYTSANLWAIATLRTEKSEIHLADGTHRIESIEELRALPQHLAVVFAEAEGKIFQSFHASWSDMDPADRYDGDWSWKNNELWSTYGESGLTVLWLPPADEDDE